jgi:hypothetical protein
MKPWKVVIGSLLLSVGCGDPEPPVGLSIDVDINVNGNNGEVLTDAFFGVAALVDQTQKINEDVNRDGNLDVFEDLDFDQRLDVAEDLNNNGVLDLGEDIDGDGNLDADEDRDNDGVLDFNNEDTNNNGILETAIEVDLNEDGVINAQDRITQSIFAFFATSGVLSCEELVASIQENNGQPSLDGAVLQVLGAQLALGPKLPNIFVQGQTVTTSFSAIDFTSVQPLFGVFEDNTPINNSFADGGGQLSSIKIDALGDLFSGTISGEVQDGANVVIPYTAAVANVPVCDALSDTLLVLLENGILTN